MFGWFRNLASSASASETTPPARNESTAPAPPAPAVPQPETSVPAAPQAVTVEPAAQPQQPPAAPAPAPSETEKAAAKPTTRRARHSALTDGEELTIEAPSEPVAESTASDAPVERRGIVAAPSSQPAMPLTAHPNFAGLELARWADSGPQLLEPEAALRPEMQRELFHLFDDLFGPAGRYRLEWRTDRKPSDDAVFAELLAVDLVRRVQNAIADTAELERPEPLPELTARRHQQPPHDDTELRQAS
ncbi:hypothetical protein [uncultured Gulosibacter sp.]|uniref:hypothetical protein n=1 Tax=uncultured Gulosibacter sp. TaxID=1339167 RepID=UPI00288B4922|nr:hypothetical protein [uncultured Gulosibacter sp.]